MMENSKFYTRSKIWLEDSQGNVVFGLGRYRILNEIKHQGSLNAAAKKLKMGYRAIWARINATEERLGQSLLVKKVGGTSGGGSQLTPLAEDLLKRFDKIRINIEQKTDLLFEEDLGSHMVINPKKDSKTGKLCGKGNQEEDIDFPDQALL
ncbi:winged helix-turn-helix domain-containing protein [Desulfobacula toluolica]|uniref:Predicted transcriptional regulator, LysR family n=1 Tax=Desulfobacula toluolica (strain DSM 7467 / Tol2) TaxID=651182 RepID=K0NLX8_DESTT|nr:LysR family transcriptional regulator [Desulfobacula toluolica]CCK82516.1 predicted transcriptional regulator, LysR family [Desulfobacula toluolica Tol2]